MQESGSLMCFSYFSDNNGALRFRGRRYISSDYDKTETLLKITGNIEIFKRYLLFILWHIWFFVLRSIKIMWHNHLTCMAYPCTPTSGWLWLRGRASVFLSGGHWFSSPGLHVEVSLGKMLNPKLLLMCRSAPCMAATTISVWMYELL